MTHDNLCPCDYGDCECGLIARVRADEREQAARRVEAVEQTSYFAMRLLAVAAARGEDTSHEAK